MIRTVRNFGLVAAMLLAPLSAQAVEISVSATSTGASTSVLLPGDIITFDISLSHASGETLYGLGIGVGGYDTNQNGINDDGLTFLGPNEQNTVLPAGVPIDTSGTANVADFLWAVENPGDPGNPIPGTGLVNIRGALQTPTFSVLPAALTGQPFDLNDYRGTGLGAFEFGFNKPINALLGLPTVQERWVSVFDGITTSGTSTVAPFDLSQEVAPGVSFRISFQATPESSDAVQHTLVFGEQVDFGAVAVGNGGEILSTYANSAFSFTVIPEPGTALLMGLGLVGLATRRQR